jgi:tetratricopeptide (TPR) repeat protein
VSTPKPALAAIIIAVSVAIAARAEKKYGQGEYELYSQVTKDLSAASFPKAIAGLEAWSAKHPHSDFKNNRQILYVQSYYGSKQHAKTIEAAESLLSQDPLTAFDAANDRIRVLFMVTAAADWERARADLRAAANGAMLYLALVPVAQALKNTDCATAETAALKAIESYPDSVQAFRYLAAAEHCLARKQPEKFSLALFAYARAAALDPANASTVDRIYTEYHGADPEGLQKLKELAASSTLPPPGFTIKSSSQIETEKQAEFESKNPELALWMKIKAELSGPNGDQYFSSHLKDAAVPQLFGTLISAKPACRPTELLIAIRPAGGPPEITLKLAKPLPGKPAFNRELRWEGIPTVFVKEPFMLTMQTEPPKIEGLKTTPCVRR